MHTTLSDILLWPNGVWCYREDSHEYSHMSDDYQVLKTETQAWCAFLSEQGWHEDVGDRAAVPLTP